MSEARKEVDSDQDNREEDRLGLGSATKISEIKKEVIESDLDSENGKGIGGTIFLEKLVCVLKIKEEDIKKEMDHKSAESGQMDAIVLHSSLKKENEFDSEETADVLEIKKEHELLDKVIDSVCKTADDEQISEISENKQAPISFHETEMQINSTTKQESEGEVKGTLMNQATQNKDDKARSKGLKKSENESKDILENSDEKEDIITKAIDSEEDAVLVKSKEDVSIESPPNQDNDKETKEETADTSTSPKAGTERKTIKKETDTSSSPKAGTGRKETKEGADKSSSPKTGTESKKIKEETPTSSSPNQDTTKKPQEPIFKLPDKTRKQNLSTESLTSVSRIPKRCPQLGRSVSMLDPRVSNPGLLSRASNLAPTLEKTPVKKPAQKIPYLIQSQRKPGVLKRSFSMQMPRKAPTEIAEGMTLVLAVPVTRDLQNISRSSGESSQPFLISPYQEEHVLSATCPISGITRHIKIIL